jgi:hypothetical protein
VQVLNMESMDAFIQTLGLTVMPVPGDGNCFFYAVLGPLSPGVLRDIRRKLSAIER